jgi:hypothetical protein
MRLNTFSLVFIVIYVVNFHFFVIENKTSGKECRLFFFEHSDIIFGSVNSNFVDCSKDSIEVEHNCLIEISLIKLNSYRYTRRFLLYCLIWFIFHYYYYLRVLKSSLYLSSRPLVSIRVAANTHTCMLLLISMIYST